MGSEHKFPWVGGDMRRGVRYLRFTCSDAFTLHWVWEDPGLVDAICGSRTYESETKGTKLTADHAAEGNCKKPSARPVRLIRAENDVWESALAAEIAESGRIEWCQAGSLRDSWIRPR